MSLCNVFRTRKGGLWVQVFHSESDVFPVQTPVGGWPDFEAQTCYEAPGDLWVYISKKQ